MAPVSSALKLLSLSTLSMRSRRSAQGLLFTIIVPHRSFSVRHRRPRKIAVKKGKNARAQGTSSASPWHQRRALTLCGTGESHTTIDILSDDVLLGIFDFCRKNHDYTRHEVWKWHLLVYVCQRWRQVIFASPHRLNLQLSAHSGLLSGRNWVSGHPSYRRGLLSYLERGLTHNDEDNIIAALEHPNRVCYVNLRTTSLQLGKVATAMQAPSPVLKFLPIYLAF